MDKEDIFITLEQLLSKGAVIAYPTETVYGLGCDPFQKEAVERLLILKQRPEDRPFIILIPDRSWLSQLVESVSPLAMSLIERFWPGPLTLVQQASKEVPSWLKQKDGTIAVRVSSHPWVQDFLKFYKNPIVSTSANVSGRPPASSAEEVQNTFSNAVDFVVLGDPLPFSLGSTIVKIEGSKLDILRTGAISKEEIYGASRTL